MPASSTARRSIALQRGTAASRKRAAGQVPAQPRIRLRALVQLPVPVLAPVWGPMQAPVRAQVLPRVRMPVPMPVMSVQQVLRALQQTQVVQALRAGRPAALRPLRAQDTVPIRPIPSP